MSLPGLPRQLERVAAVVPAEAVAQPLVVAVAEAAVAVAAVAEAVAAEAVVVAVVAEAVAVAAVVAEVAVAEAVVVEAVVAEAVVAEVAEVAVAEAVVAEVAVAEVAEVVEVAGWWRWRRWRWRRRWWWRRWWWWRWRRPATLAARDREVVPAAVRRGGAYECRAGRGGHEEVHRAAALLSARVAVAARAKRRGERPGPGVGRRQDEVPDLLARSRVDTGEIDSCLQGPSAFVPLPSQSVVDCAIEGGPAQQKNRLRLWRIRR